MIKTRKTLQGYVERGMARYDVLEPGWITLVDIARFEIDDRGACLVGQLEGEYDDYVDTVLEEGVQPWQYGFDLEIDNDRPYAEEIAEWDLLQSIWIEKLTEKKAQG